MQPASIRTWASSSHYRVTWDLTLGGPGRGNRGGGGGAGAGRNAVAPRCSRPGGAPAGQPEGGVDNHPRGWAGSRRGGAAGQAQGAAGQAQRGGAAAAGEGGNPAGEGPGGFGGGFGGRGGFAPQPPLPSGTYRVVLKVDGKEQIQLLQATIESNSGGNNFFGDDDEDEARDRDQDDPDHDMDDPNKN